jgi:ribosome-associated protein
MGLISVTSDLAIDEREVEESFVHAAGPGGQNVNKVATAVQLRFDAAHSPSLPEDVRARLVGLAGRRLTKDGVIVIFARRFRTQEQNRRDARRRLIELIGRAAISPRARRATRPPRAAHEQRLKDKKSRARRKTLRSSLPEME